jgi:hypothetical protein
VVGWDDVMCLDLVRKIGVGFQVLNVKMGVKVLKVFALPPLTFMVEDECGIAHNDWHCRRRRGFIKQ